ncbi:MAG TPA: sortase [Anaerolineales bacterium]|nr:sortase [Anaerolineales bacterium]
MRKIYPEDLSLTQIRYLLLEKRRAVRHSRLEQFLRTGRVSPIVGEASAVNEFRALATRDSMRGQELRPRTWLDGFLLIVEFLAVIGLVAIVASGLSTLGAFNKTVAASLQQPTLEPTPMIQAVVLPDGHTPPTGPGGARPNEAEIPEHLRPLWQSFSNLPTPLPAMEQAIRIQIPAINVDAPVVQGDSWDQLKKGVGQQIGTPDPGKNGNIVLSGHNDVYGEVFRYLDRLNPGDKVILFTSQRQYTYIITRTQMVEPTAVEVMAQTADARVTLISCHPYLIDDHRIVVSAVLQGP